MLITLEPHGIFLIKFCIRITTGKRMDEALLNISPTGRRQLVKCS